MFSERTDLCMKVKLSLRENRIINIFKNKIEEKFPEEKILIL